MFYYQIIASVITQASSYFTVACVMFMGIDLLLCLYLLCLNFDCIPM